ncbi:hypothetical protein SASPL_148588 [Salvia splendens]|uniref:DUF7746 domain-containing protein n=1 Tax=Salvia splendens TaxID=180675 RepID=A0A8X8WAF8_SALSN|nr:hypothetical protein SASPL_148588 [Salvia splendens]
MYALQKRDFPDFKDERVISTLETSLNDFKTVSGKIIKSIHPPEMNLSIKTLEGEILASPYKGSSAGKFEDIVSQNNFTNLYLKTLGDQMNRIEKVSQNTEVENLGLNFGPKRDSKVLFKPMPSDKLDINFCPNVSSEMIGEIAKSLGELEKQFENMRIEDDPLEVNKLSSSYKKKMVYKIPAKPYYHRPTPVDLQLEQFSEYNACSYDGKSINEWNIDGLSEYQIQAVINYKTMYASAHRVNGTTDPIIARAIIQGFTGQLKG